MSEREKYSLHLKKAAAKTCRVDDIGYTKRAGKGEQILQLAAGDRVEKVVQLMESGE